MPSKSQLTAIAMSLVALAIVTRIPAARKLVLNTQ
jgi:hypothetical protein